MNKKIMIFCGFLAIISIIICFFSYFLPTFITNSRLETAAVSAKSMEVEDGYVFKDISDWWGQPIKINCRPTDDGMAFLYTATSSGQDRISGSNDDLAKVAIDLNKSKIVGKYTAKKLKEFVKGFKDGEKEPSKFDEK